MRNLTTTLLALITLQTLTACDEPEPTQAGPVFTDGTTVDRDGDGYGGTIDCDDNDPTVGDRIMLWHDYDRDGYGSTPTLRCPNWLDDDDDVDSGDLLVTNGDDCDDTKATTHPGALELCDLVDNDCDGLPDDYDAEDLDPNDAEIYWLDVDGDGYGRPYAEIYRCAQPYGYADNADDCDDDDPRVPWLRECPA